MKKINKSFKKVKNLPTVLYMTLALIIKGYKIIFIRTRLIDPYNCFNIDKLPYITVTWHNRILYLAAMIKKNLEREHLL